MPGLDIHAFVDPHRRRLRSPEGLKAAAELLEPIDDACRDARRQLASLANAIPESPAAAAAVHEAVAHINESQELIDRARAAICQSIGRAVIARS